MSETESKRHTASSRKLRKQREDGSIPSSQDLAGLIAAAAGIAVVAAIAPAIWQKISASISLAPDLLVMPFEDAIAVAGSSFSWLLFLAVIPIVITTICVGVIAGLVFNKGVVFAMKPVTPQINRVSPKEGIKRIYGKRGWIEVAASFTRILVWLAIAGFCAFLFLPSLVRSPDCTGLCQARMILPLVWSIVICAVVLLLIYAAIDMVIQTNLFMHEQRMTESEKKRELQEQMGSKEVRKERNRLRNEAQKDRPQNLGLNDVTMLVTSGENAIAIAFHPPEIKLPYIVAKARTSDELAGLRQKLRAANIPEFEDTEVLKAGIGQDIGGIIDQSAFEAFARLCRGASE